MPRADGIHDWLSATVTASAGGRYRHKLVTERPGGRAAFLNELRSLVDKEHEDVRRHLRAVAGVDLDPFGSTGSDPAAGYPRRLHLNNLKGYFGEILAGLVAENFPPFGHSWQVPAYLFRFDIAGINELLRLGGGRAEPKPVPGRLGDDCLAFERDGNGRIVRCLVSEAKCTSGHDTDMIKGVHLKLSDPRLKPIDILRLIEILRERQGSEAHQWVASLRELWGRDDLEDFERVDHAHYICGQTPKTRKSWILSERPHAAYTGGRSLEAVEMHFGDVEALVRAAYAEDT